MALIEKAKGRRQKQSPSGYTRLFGISELGNLMSRVQGAVIASGNELERMIWERVTYQVQDLDDFLKTELHSFEDKVFVAKKEQVKSSASIKSSYEPDFIAFYPKDRHCYIVEVKDGDTFDTKKAAGEREMLRNFTNDVSRGLPYRTSVHMCCFNAGTREEAYYGLKKKFAINELLTGRELAEKFGFDYDDIVKIRANDQRHNLDYFVRSLLTIEDVRQSVISHLDG